MNRVVRWIGVTLGSLVALLLVAVGVLYAVSGSRLGARKQIASEEPLVIPTDSASIARGAHLVGAIPCGQCHGPDLGGNVFADEGPFALLAAPNLTRGRGGPNPPLTDAEWERAIRHGIRRDSTSLIVMPSNFFHSITDEDMAPMIAYLKQIPPVDREVERAKLRILGRMLMGAGQFKMATDLTPSTAHVAAIDTTPSVEYGRYIMSISGCFECHGPSLSGGPGPGPESPPAANITPTGIGHYTEEDFRTAMRTGARPGGGVPLNEEMPWKYYGTMTDGELHAIWLFLKTVPPKAFGES